MSYAIRFERAVQKAIQKKIHPRDAARIREALEALSEESYPRQSLKRIDREGCRIRVGNYRVIYEVDEADAMITVFQIGHRQGIYGRGTEPPVFAGYYF